MPFAPVMRDVDAASYLLNYDSKTSYTAQFMTVTYNVTDKCKEESPAVVHIDGTARPQVVHPGMNDGMYDILSKYKGLTGRGILVNTSFNMHNEPIVCSPQDAVSAYQRGNLDILVLNDFLIVNEQSRSDRIRSA
jgi:carbamoyltransferase